MIASNVGVITYLTVHNRSPTMNLAYKIKTTAPKCYQVKPFQGTVEVSKSGKVEISYMPIPVRIRGLTRYRVTT
jgi:hypothetical protein